MFCNIYVETTISLIIFILVRLILHFRVLPQTHLDYAFEMFEILLNLLGCFIVLFYRNYWEIEIIIKEFFLVNRF